MIAAALAGHHLKTTVHEGRGGTCAAEMDECGEILLLLRACRCVWRAGKNCRELVVQVHGREFDGMARDRAAIEARAPAVAIYDSVSLDTVACRLGVSCIGHLVHAHSARGGLVHREGIPGELPAPGGAGHRIAGAFDPPQSAWDILASSPVAAARAHSGWAAALSNLCQLHRRVAHEAGELTK